MLTEESCVLIFLEFMSGGSVREMLKTFGPFRSERFQRVSRVIRTFLGCLHLRSVNFTDTKQPSPDSWKSSGSRASSNAYCWLRVLHVRV